jgi:hypothetical protein
MMPVLRESDHTYWLDGKQVPGVTSILAPLSNFDFVSADVLKAAADFGTAVHLACELDDYGTLDEEELDPALAPYLSAWRKFSAEHKVQWTAIEELVYHPSLRYAGKLDRYGVVDGTSAVVDIKSSAALYPSVGPQLAAYLRAIPDALPLTKRLAVQLRPDATYVLKEYTSALDFPAFASLVTLRNWCAANNVTPSFKEPEHV